MKTTIDHTLRQKMGITCDEYVLLDCIKNSLPLIKPFTWKGVFDDVKAHALTIDLTTKGILNVAEDGMMSISNKVLSVIKPDNTTLVAEIVTFLNKEADAKFKADAKPTQQVINARLKEGYNYEDFTKVIRFKCREWLHTDQEQYLRPITLFGNKFEGYLQAAIKAEPKAPENKNMEGMVM